jgi:kynurenine formamidase
VLLQQITTFVHWPTHTHAHVIEGAGFMDEVALSKHFGTGVLISIPKE